MNALDTFLESTECLGRKERGLVAGQKKINKTQWGWAHRGSIGCHADVFCLNKLGNIGLLTR